jgi:Fungal Zn(2)-Cys(6) binuclear cluster domain
MSAAWKRGVLSQHVFGPGGFRTYPCLSDSFSQPLLISMFHSMAGSTPSNSPTTTRATPARPELREFQRAYKACVPCRKRKSRCELSAEDYSAGRPCTRCRRELKECVFTAERHTTKRPKLDTNEDASKTPQTQTPGTPTRGSGGMKSPPQPQARLQSIRRHHQMHAPAEQPKLAAQNRDSRLSDPMMRTVLASGSDALNLLFEAANQSGGDLDLTRVDNGASNSSTTHPTSPNFPVQPRPSVIHSKLVNPSSDVLEVWNACRFVRMGWFSAEEAVLLVDL